MKFNELKPKENSQIATTKQSGFGYKSTLFESWFNLAMNSQFKADYFESADSQVDSLVELTEKLATGQDKGISLMDMVKAVVYLRTVEGRRTASYIAAAVLAKYIGGKVEFSKFFTRRDKNGLAGGMLYRLDDMLEIWAAYNHFNKFEKEFRYNSVMAKGFKQTLENATAYEVAKYKNSGKKYSLVELMRRLKPNPTKNEKFVWVSLPKYKKALKTAKNFKQTADEVVDVEKNLVKMDAFKALYLGLLKRFDTREDKLQAIGQEAKKAENAKEFIAEARFEEYKNLLTENKFGINALLKDLRLMMTFDKDNLLVDLAEKVLTNEQAIIKSLVSPIDVDMAMYALEEDNTISQSQLKKILPILEKTYDLSCQNLKELGFDENTMIVFDASGSMAGGMVDGMKRWPLDKATLLAATLFKYTNADVLYYSEQAHFVKGLRVNDTIQTTKQKLMGCCYGGGTNFGAIMPMATRQYSRIIILSDMQNGEVGYSGDRDNNTFQNGVKEYTKKFEMPYIYLVNMCKSGSDTKQYRNNPKVFNLAGYKSLFTTMKNLEKGQTILDEIRKIVL